MIWLDSGAIQRAIDICKTHERYKVAIAFFNQQRMNSAQALISILIPQPDNRYRVRCYRHGFEVRFRNGSMLRSIVASDQSRGQRANLLIVDEGIPNHIISNVLQRIETPYSGSSLDLDNQTIYMTSRGE